MVIYAIDDEQNALEYLVDKIKKVKPEAEIVPFTKATEAVESAKERPFDVAFMDIQMPKINGIALAKKFKAINPKANMIFVTGYSEYTMDAFAVDASGYLLKPATAAQIEHALENLRYPLVVEKGPDITICCFGNFEVFYKGEPLHFKYVKSKEMLAYMVDRKGAMCSGDEICVALWEDDDNHKSYLRSMFKDITDVFESIGCKDAIIRQRGGIAIVTSKVRCDYYDWVEGLPSGINAYHGEYMNQYSWAEDTGAMLFDDYYENIE